MAKPDPLDIQAQEEALAQAQERTRLEMRQDKEDLLWLMSGKRGRRVVYRMLERSGVWRLSFNTNALQMAFNEGTRNEGLALTARLMSYCPEQYTEMLKESAREN